MTADIFWDLIEASKREPDQCAWLKRKLVSLGPIEILDYAKIFSSFHRNAYRHDLWAAAWLLGDGGCSDDRFMDFRAWLISQGKATYNESLRNPDTLADAHWPFFEEFNYVDDEAYREATGNELPDVDLSPMRHEPLGVPWEIPDLKNLLPTVWKRQKHIFEHRDH